jgi:hypothetical protein
VKEGRPRRKFKFSLAVCARAAISPPPRPPSSTTRACRAMAANIAARGRHQLLLLLLVGIVAASLLPTTGGTIHRVLDAQGQPTATAGAGGPQLVLPNLPLQFTGNLTVFAHLVDAVRVGLCIFARARTRAQLLARETCAHPPPSTHFPTECRQRTTRPRGGASPLATTTSTSGRAARSSKVRGREGTSQTHTHTRGRESPAGGADARPWLLPPSFEQTRNPRERSLPPP